MRMGPAPSLAGDEEAAAPEEKPPTQSGVFAGLHLLFWVVAFTGPLKNGSASSVPCVLPRPQLSVPARN